MPSILATDDLLGAATPTPVELDAIASAIFGHAVTVGRWRSEPVPYAFGSPATAALVRVLGTTTEGRPWSVFVKVLQHPRHWRMLDRIPAALRADFLDNFPWRAELGAWEPGFHDRLPSGLRVPKLYRVSELVEDRVAIWMENVITSDQSWTLDTFRLAARLLGALSGRRSDAELLDACPVPPGYGLSRYYDGAVVPVLPCLESHDLWQHPRVVAADGARLRSDLRELATRAPAIMDSLNRLPQSLPHGDASPQNLLVPLGEPDTLVAIDLAFQCPLAVGFDLAQLLVGLVHAGQMPASDLPHVYEVLAPAYLEGLSQGAPAVSLDEVAFGFVGSLVIRAAFTALPFHEPPARVSDEYIDQRLALTRFIADRGLGLLPACSRDRR